MTAVIAEPDLIIEPCLPPFGGIFDLPGRQTPVATHMPHGPFENLEEHLHEHLPHMHISYGFKVPKHDKASLPKATKLSVVMAIRKEHRVDCNPIFVSRKSPREGECLKIAGDDVHWIHSDETARRATELFARTGRRLPEDMYFSGFVTSTPDEREERAYTRDELYDAIGDGLLVEQHFQATWQEPRDEAIEPYDVTIYLGNTTTNYHTFFRLPAVVPLGAS